MNKVFIILLSIGLYKLAGDNGSYTIREQLKLEDNKDKLVCAMEVYKMVKLVRILYSYYTDKFYQGLVVGVIAFGLQANKIKTVCANIFNLFEIYNIFLEENDKFEDYDMKLSYDSYKDFIEYL